MPATIPVEEESDFGYDDEDIDSEYSGELEIDNSSDDTSNDNDEAFTDEGNEGIEGLNIDEELNDNLDKWDMIDDNIGIVDGGKDCNLHSVFENIKQFRSALQEFAIKCGFNILRLNNERKRVRVICASDGCPWRVLTTVSYNSNATSGWIAKVLSARLREEPDISIKSMMTSIQEQFGVVVHKLQCYRAKQIAKGEHSCNHIAAYFKLPAYCLDGCHLRERYGGIILSAVSVDGNNCLFPLAFAIVEVGNTATCEFFLHNLANALQDSMDYMNLTFMTNKQNGLINAISSIFSDAHYRIYCRHLYSNFKASFPGLLLKSLFWKATQASSTWVYERAIEKMKDTNMEAHD
ncbi:uncharacterized protein LOC122659223 [Telopea speciosissima]|uniref:uncharacterized protein LOC122659223 n=1 Tax=Telopea speciosissima TaxID=54955 RepID=UPI001CC4CBA3|nr:uncharacterized protein LOC122659223 [Telopea speciosissima]